MFGGSGRHGNIIERTDGGITLGECPPKKLMGACIAWDEMVHQQKLVLDDD